MIKIVLLLRRRPDLSPEQFRQHWHELHAPLVRQLPGLRRLILNDVLPGADGAMPDLDGISEDWFDNLDDMQRAFASPEAQAVNEDVVNFLDMRRFQVLSVVEREVALPLNAAA